MDQAPLKACRLASIKDEAEKAVLEAALSALAGNERLLVIATGEVPSLENLTAGTRCDFLHLLAGNFLYGHVHAVREVLARQPLSPAEQDEVTAVAIYNGLRFYYPAKNYLRRHGFEALHLPAPVMDRVQRQPLSLEKVVAAAARSLGLAIMEVAE